LSFAHVTRVVSEKEWQPSWRRWLIEQKKAGHRTTSRQRSRRTRLKLAVRCLQMTVHRVAKKSSDPTKLCGFTCMHAQSGHPRFCSHTPFERRTPIYCTCEDAGERFKAFGLSIPVNTSQPLVSSYQAIQSYHFRRWKLECRLRGNLREFVGPNAETMSFGNRVYF
jgi:hypothetical protein